MKAVLTMDEVRKMLRFAVENSMSEGPTADRVSGSVRFIHKYSDGSGEAEIETMARIDRVEVTLSDGLERAGAKEDNDPEEVDRTKGFDEGCLTVKDERDKLRAFAHEILTHTTGSLDGFDLQEIGESHGLLEQIEATEPCTPQDADGDYPGCVCTEVGFPCTCYRRTALLTGEATERDGE